MEEGFYIFDYARGEFVQGFSRNKGRYSVPVGAHYVRYTPSTRYAMRIKNPSAAKRRAALLNDCRGRRCRVISAAEAATVERAGAAYREAKRREEAEVQDL